MAKKLYRRERYLAKLRPFYHDDDINLGYRRSKRGWMTA